MNKLIATLAVLGLALPFLPAAGAEYSVGLQPGPCDPPGPVFVIYQTEYVVIPTDGYSWDGENVETHGDSGNVQVWAYNQDVPGSCLGIVMPATGDGESNPCPPAGRTPAWEQVTVYRPTGTHWDPEGRLWVDGYYDTYSVGGQNNRFAGRCYGTAYAGVASEEVSWCVNCISTHDDWEPPTVATLP